MSGNPPRPGADPNDDLPDQVVKMRATIGCLELLVPFSKQDRMTIIVGLCGVCDETMAALIATRIGGKR
jgi:hypothetical protein